MTNPIPLSAMLAVFLAGSLAADELRNSIAAQAKAARAILDPWLGKPAESPGRFLHIVYWTPKDREPAQHYERRLTGIMEHIRDFYADEMERIGLGRRSINLKYGEDEKLLIHLVKGVGPYADYNVQSGGKIREECLPTLKEAGIDADRETILIFCNMADWDPVKHTLKHRSPYYASGSHRQGTAWQLDSPILDTRHLGKKEPKMHDGQYGHISIGKHNSIFIGGIAHELGHALGLPHNKERPDEKSAFGTALMGAGNRTYGDEIRKEGKGSFLTLAHALRLASHPQFSDSTKGMSFPVKNDISELAFEKIDGGFEVSGTVTGNPPVYAVVAYTDPDGGGDYDATTATAVPDAGGRFRIRCDALRKGRAGVLRLFALHANGAVSGRMSQTRYSWPYNMDGNGKIDLSNVKRRLALAPMVKAARFGDEKAIAEAFEHLHKNAPDGPDGKTHRIGKRIAAGNAKPLYAVPEKIIADRKTVPLADTRASEAKVGWARVTYNRVPAATVLLESGGKIYEHGIYAHAPARHVYKLGGEWGTLEGFCGVASGHRGTVEFVVRGNGKELWRSGKADKTRKISVDVKDVDELELIVEDAGDGTSGDWGLWLEPVLKR